MATTLATIIGMELNKEFSDRAYYKALKETKSGADKRIQPIPGTEYGYFVIKAKTKASAEEGFNEYLSHYRTLGGVEFDSTVIPEGSVSPAISGINNDQAETYTPKKGTYHEDERGMPYFTYED